MSRNFPAIMPSGSFMGEIVSKRVCAQLAAEIVSQVPRIDDYLCPVCFGIAWLPVRLTCRHVFCIRCMIKMQRDRKRFCPLCRANVIMEADTGSFFPFHQVLKYLPHSRRMNSKANFTRSESR